MQIIHLNEQTFHDGRYFFRLYLAGLACGPKSDLHAAAQHRGTGPRYLVGAIMACIDEGWDIGHEIISAVTRSTRCRSTTVQMVLDQFTGDDPAVHLWHLVGGFYRLHEPRTRRPVLLTS